MHQNPSPFPSLGAKPAVLVRTPRIDTACHICVHFRPYYLTVVLATSSPDVNFLAGLSLTILPAPARTEIVVPPRAPSHLQHRPLLLQMTAGSKKCTGRSRNHSLRGQQPPHPMILVPVCSTRISISTSTSLWAPWTLMRMRRG